MPWLFDAPCQSKWHPRRGATPAHPGWKAVQKNPNKKPQAPRKTPKNRGFVSQILKGVAAYSWKPENLFIHDLVHLKQLRLAWVFQWLVYDHKSNVSTGIQQKASLIWINIVKFIIRWPVMKCMWWKDPRSMLETWIFEPSSSLQDFFVATGTSSVVKMGGIQFESVQKHLCPMNEKN